MTLASLIARAAEGSDASLHLNEAFGFQHAGTLKEVGRKFGKLLDVHIKAANEAIDAHDLDTAREQIAGAERIDPQALGVQLIKEKLASVEAAEAQRRRDAQARAASAARRSSAAAAK